MSAFSPGPWRWGPDESDGDHALLDSNGENVLNATDAGVDVVVHEDEDARLIAAAPEMYELLRSLISHRDDGVGSWSRWGEIRGILARIDGKEPHA